VVLGKSDVKDLADAEYT